MHLRFLADEVAEMTSKQWEYLAACEPSTLPCLQTNLKQGNVAPALAAAVREVMSDGCRIGEFDLKDGRDG